MTNYTTFDTESPSALERKMSTSHILYGTLLWLLKVGSNWGLLGCRGFPPSFIYNGSNYGDHLPKAVKCSAASSQGCPVRLLPTNLTARHLGLTISGKFKGDQNSK